MLFRIYRCLVAQGKCIFRKWFSADRVLGVNWFPFLFYLQIQFSGNRERERERAEWEWDRGRRERERAHPSGQPSSGQRDRTQKEIEPRLCRRRSTSSFNFTLRLRRSTSSFNVAVRLRLHADRDRSRSTDSSSPIANPDSSSTIAIVLDPKTDRPPSLPSSLNLTGIWFFFFPGFYLCFWIEGWNYIFVWQVRKCEKMYFLCDFDFCCRRKIAFSSIQPNTRKYFSQYFLKCIQTLKNIFLSCFGYFPFMFWVLGSTNHRVGWFSGF